MTEPDKDASHSAFCGGRTRRRRDGRAGLDESGNSRPRGSRIGELYLHEVALLINEYPIIQQFNLGSTRGFRKDQADTVRARLPGPVTQYKRREAATPTVVASPATTHNAARIGKMSRQPGISPVYKQGEGATQARRQS